jgi:lipid-binding SYLF domain-containing protein
MSLLSCRTASGSTPRQKRAATLEMQDQTLAALFRANPSARYELRRAPGYAVFANISTKILLVGLGNGYGVVTDNRAGRRTYMRMTQGGVGWGMGIKTFRVVIVFKSSFTMEDFIRSGWTFKGDAEATAKIASFGGGIGQSLVLANMNIYTLDEAGLSLTAMVQGTKFYVDSDLN